MKQVDSASVFKQLFFLACIICGLWSTVVYPQAKPGVVLGVGDVVKITVFQAPDMTTETRVTEAGTISFPLLGTVRVAGLTTTEAEARIAEGLKKGRFVVQAQVNILVLQTRSRQVSVLGQVARPGKYPIEEANTKLTDLLALAGAGIGSDVVNVMKNGGGKYKKIDVDIPALFLTGDLSKDFELGHGDIVYVQRAPVFYIYGEAARPGAYRLERKMTVMQALALAGGLTQRGTERDIKVYRRDASDTVQPLVLDLNDVVQQDDVIYIRRSLF